MHRSDRPHRRIRKKPFGLNSVAGKFAVFLLMSMAILWLNTAAVQASAADHSVYIQLSDGVKLAADVYLPPGLEPGERVPALLYQTRYWRSMRVPVVADPDVRNPDHWADAPAVGEKDEIFLSSGYAVVKVDVRGTGASFGTRPIEYGPVEVMDGYEVVDWIVNQPWSDGNVGAYGISYSGTTAEFVSANNHPALSAVVLGWSDFDAYRGLVKPYGMQSDAFISAWGTYVGLQDQNAWQALGASVRPVGEDEDASLLCAAVGEHAANVDVYAAASSITFRDEVFGDSGLSFHHISSLYWKEAIEDSDVAIFVLTSWFDAGLANGDLLRFMNYDNPQKLLIMASSHGGGSHASPYVAGSMPLDPVPTTAQQWIKATAFFDHYLKGEENGVDEWPAVTYFNLGEETYRETDVWPPEKTRRLRLFMGKNHRLTTKRSRCRHGADAYEIDFDVTTGEYSRWQTQMGGLPVLNLDDRGNMDARMLTYTSGPMPFDVQVTGHPVVSLNVASTHEDGAFLVYLEDVDEDGRSIYVTEGGLRAIHRRVTENPYIDQTTPYHSFETADARPLVPGKRARLKFALQPISVRIKKGHRIRIAIAGADKDNFDRIPALGTPTITIDRNKRRASFVDIPVVVEKWRACRKLRRMLR